MASEILKNCANGIVSAVVVPSAMIWAGYPPPYFVAGGILTAVVLYAVGHSQSLGWKRRMLPIALMAGGALAIIAGAVWFHGQKPADAMPPTTPLSSTAATPTSPVVNNPDPRPKHYPEPHARHGAPHDKIRPTETTPMRDSYTNNGTNNGIIGPVSLGKQPFSMTEQVMASVASQLGVPRLVGIYWTGSLRSGPAAEKLKDYLIGKGFVVEDRGSSMMEIPPLEQPIELRGDTLYVDVTK